MGSRRTFSREMKLSIVQQLGSRSASEICREHDVQPNLLYRWSKEYESNPTQAFQGPGKMWKEEAKTAHYERLIGQLYAEIDLLKKNVERLSQLRVEETGKRRSTK